MSISRTIVATAVATASSLPVLAQEAHFELPEQCTASSAMGHGPESGGTGSGMMDMMGMEGTNLDAMPEHVQENMRKMMITMPAMHAGTMNEDADVAFACGMIAHHQGAIDMAEVLLDHGDDEQMRALAEEIIATQVTEMEEMTNWLAEHAE